jgi:hypothetical protein
VEWAKLKLFKMLEAEAEVGLSIVVDLGVTAFD